MWGLDVAKAGGPALAKDIATRCFDNGHIIERCGRDDTVMKVMPPLTIDIAHLNEGLGILEAATEAALAAAGNSARVEANDAAIETA
jgi:diaminobutyrate-2-oxoglutarate transaminase